MTGELFTPIEWLAPGRVRFLDQTRLPQEEDWVETADYHRLAEAIRRLEVRGAPLIGVAAAYGLALAAFASPAEDDAGMLADIQAAADVLRATRPTAVNLGWALDRVLAAIRDAGCIDEIRKKALDMARVIHEEDIAGNRRIGGYGAQLIPAGARVLTHCNAGALATGGYGTALGVLQSAWDEGRIERVVATETRPLLQGARLTAWELRNAGIPFTLIPDSAAGQAMRRGQVGAVVVGADRIAANGDVANKIGTYQLAVLAHENGIPFYVAAPTSTIDPAIPDGDHIPIEERSGDEVRSVRGTPIAPEGTEAANPAFDVTPNTYVTAIITENGIAHAPYEESLRALYHQGVTAVG